MIPERAKVVRSVRIGDEVVPIELPEAIWEILQEIAQRERLDLQQLCNLVAKQAYDQLDDLGRALQSFAVLYMWKASKSLTSG